MCSSVVLTILLSGEECKKTSCNVIFNESGLMAGNYCLHVSAAANERSERRKVEESMKLQPVRSERRGEGGQKRKTDGGWMRQPQSRKCRLKKRNMKWKVCCSKSLPSVKGQP